MNTVEALNVLGKALCGDSFEVKPGLTDAETILEIAKNYTGGGGESGGGRGPRLISFAPDNQGRGQIESGLTPMDFVNAYIWEDDDEFAGFTPIIYLDYNKSNDYMYVTAMAVNAADTYYEEPDLMLLKYKYYPETGMLQMLGPSD